MKKASFLGLLVVGVLVLGIAPTVLAGAYDELLPDAVKGKLFVPSLKLKWEFDDNIYTTTAAEERNFGIEPEESSKLYVEPKIDIHYLTTASYLGLTYQFSYIWYADREGDDDDMAHDANLDVRHSFSPSVEVILRDIFRSSEEPEVAEDIVTAGGIRTIPLQRNGDYLYNRVTAGLNLKTGNRLWWDWSYTNLWVDFDEPETVFDAARAMLRPGASFYFDRMSNIGAVKAQYLATPQSKINLGVIFTDTEYDSEILMKDSTSWIVFAGLDQNLAKTCIGSINVGWENRDYDDLDLSQDSPFVDLSVASKLGKKGNGRIGYRFALDEADQSAYALEELHTLYAGVNAFLANWTSLHLYTSYEIGSFDNEDVVAARDFGDRDENVWLLGLTLRQHVTKDIYVEGGYRRTDVDSDFEGSDYDRNRYFVGVGGIF